MIASMAIAVLPVPRSPMISSRCPLPIGIRASIARMPVWSGCLTPWDRRDPPRATNDVAFLDLDVGAHDGDADRILFEVEDNAVHAVGELDEFRRLRVVEAVDPRDVVADLDHGPDLGLVGSGLEEPFGG